MIGMRGNNPMFRLKLQVSVNVSVNSQQNYHKPPQTMTWTTTNDDMNHHKSLQITTSLPWHESPQITNHYNHHKPWHKPPWTMTETSTKHDMNHYKSPQTMTWTIMMTQKELCIKPYGFLVLLCSAQRDEVFANNINLTFLYKIDIKGFQKVSANNKIASSGN